MPFDPYANGYSDTWRHVAHPRYANVTDYISDTPRGYGPRRHRSYTSSAQISSNSNTDVQAKGETDAWDV